MFFIQMTTSKFYKKIQQSLPPTIFYIFLCKKGTMKKIFLIFVIGILSLNLSAQLYVDGKDINQMPEIHYCEVSLGFRGSAIVDYGQKFRTFSNKSKITDESRNVIYFNNYIHLLNYMYNHGWKFICHDTLDHPFLFERRETNSMF